MKKKAEKIIPFLRGIITTNILMEIFVCSVRENDTVSTFAFCVGSISIKTLPEMKKKRNPISRQTFLKV